MRQHRKRVRLVGGNSISGGTCCRTELLGRVNDDDTCRATDLSMKDTTKVMSTTALITQTTCDVTIPFLQHARCMRGACARSHHFVESLHLLPRVRLAGDDDGGRIRRRLYGRHQVVEL